MSKNIKNNKNTNKKAPKRWKDTHPTKLKVRLLGNEVFIIYVSQDMTVEELRKLVELATGIPYDLQRLTYLDEAELIETTTLKENEIVPGGALELTVWHMWLDLIEKAVIGEIPDILQLGVSPQIPFSSPITEYMDEETKLAWLRKRAFVVLCIAAHRENLLLCQEMLWYVGNVDTRTPVGRTVLHIAASQGKSEVLKMLLEKGSKLGAKDHDGLKAIDMTVLFGHAEAERLLALMNWKEKQQRTRIVKKPTQPPQPPKKEEEKVSEDIVPELTPESQVAVPVVTITPATEDEPQSQTLTETPTVQPMSDVPVVATKDEPRRLTLTKTPTVYPMKVPPTSSLLNKTVLEIQAAAEAEVDKVPELEADNHPPAGYSQDPDTFRHYLLTLKKQSKHFGYAASVIDDHLLRLDDVRYHSFHRKALASENDNDNDNMEEDV